MLIFHIYRNVVSPCLFKEIMLQTLYSNIGDNFYLSSGFFGENCHFSASNDTSSFSSNSFVSNPFASNLTAYLIGCYNARGLIEFNNFASNLAGAGYHTFRSYRTSRHAKVFLYQKGSVPIVEIIGSSNMTARAYGSRCPYNQEADLVIINNEYLENIFAEMLTDNDDNNFIMRIFPNNCEEILNDIINFRDSYLNDGNFIRI